MIRLSAKQFRYFVAQSVLGAALVNAVINGAFGWGLVRERTELPLWAFGAPCVIGDFIVMAFSISFGTCFMGTRQARKDLAAGKVDIPTLPATWLTLGDRLPVATFPRSVVLGLLSVPLFVPVVILALVGMGVGSMSPGGFIAVKTIFGAVQGALVTPLIVLVSLTTKPKAASTAPGAR